MTSAPKHRWFRFSLRTLFVVVTLLALSLGSCAYRVREQKAAIAAVQLAGGSVYYTYMFDSEGCYVCDSEPPGPQQLWEHLDRDYFFDVVQVIIADTESLATNDTIREVSRLTRLQELHVQAPKINDGALEHLKKLRHLEELSFVETPISRPGADDFKRARPDVSIYVHIGGQDIFVISP